MEFSSELELDIPNMCRVCLLQKEKLNNIYTNCIVEGYVIPLPDIIKSCLDLHLKKDDKNLPKKICDQCKIQVINFYSFKEKSKKVEEALKNLLSTARFIKEENGEESGAEKHINNKVLVKIEDSTSNVQLAYQEQETSEENNEIKVIETPVVGSILPNENFSYADDTKHDLEIITTKHDNDNNETVESQQTLVELEEIVEDEDDIEELEELLGEINEESSELEDDIKDEPPQVAGYALNICKICDKKFETVNNLKRHLDTHNGIFFKCRICPKMYAHQASRNRHMRIRHLKQVKVIMSQKENPFQRNDPLNPPIKIIPNEDTVSNEPITSTREIILNEKNSDESNSQLPAFSNDDEMYVDDYEYICTICDINFKYEIMFVDHAKYEHPDIFCSKCCKLFSSSDERNTHLSEEHTSETKSNKTNNTASRNFCRFCQKKLKSVIELNTHKELHDTLNKWMENSESPPMVTFCPCYECNTIFLSEEGLQGHNSAKHGGSSKKFNLDDDSIECTDYQFLEDDEAVMSTETNLQVEKPFICGVCNVQLPNENEMRNHIIIHSTKLSCPFDECGCQYTSFSRLSLHIIHRHLNRDEFKCTHCGETCTNYDDLQNHQKKACPERKYNCTHCDKSFFSLKALGIHMKSAIETKAKLCQICGKSFSHQGELKIHSRTHTGERPYQCNICGKSYKTASMRTAHMDAHIQGKTFLCTICDKKLQTRTSFRNHMRRHTEEKKHQCTICTKKFFTKYHVKLHTMKIHDNPKRLQNKNVEIAVQNIPLY